MRSEGNKSTINGNNEENKSTFEPTNPEMVQTLADRHQNIMAYHLDSASFF